MDNNANTPDRLTPDTATPAQPANPVVPAQPTTPFAQAGAATPPVQTENAAPAAPAELPGTVPPTDNEVAAAKEAIQAPATPPAPAAPIAPEVPTTQAQPTTPAFGGINTSNSVATPQAPTGVDLQPSQSETPTKGAFVPKSMNIAAQARETYHEDGNQKAHAMRAILAAQPKSYVQVPLQPGEKPGTMLPVGINGYFLYIKKGVMVSVPVQVAEMIAESFNLDYANGEELDLSRNEDKQRALA